VGAAVDMGAGDGTEPRRGVPAVDGSERGGGPNGVGRIGPELLAFLRAALSSAGDHKPGQPIVRIRRECFIADFLAGEADADGDGAERG